VEIAKLTPDCEMVKDKILQAIHEKYQAVSAIITPDDVKVEKGENGFSFQIAVFGSLVDGGELVKGITEYLKSRFCGHFYGECVRSQKTAEDIEVEEKHENIEYVVPVRSFPISDFTPLEWNEQLKVDKPKIAIYVADVNFESDRVIICGRVDTITEKTYKNKKGQEKPLFNIQLNDGSASMRVTYFARQANLDKIRAIKEGDYIVCTGETEVYNGSLRYTAKYLDYGNPPKDFVPEKRKGKPCPQYYETVFPKPFEDFSQANMFSDNAVPDCLKGKTFVVFDLETTGLISSPAAGTMDKIIEIGAFKIVDGIIKESFTTFINPEKKLSEEIIKLTGIDDSMVANAPTYQKVMPDFYKFCNGSILVGHNIAGFDFKFVDYYCTQCGYMLERNLMDTLLMGQQQLFLANYKLNTLADYFGITFNHHRAIDDALATAKIFLELVKLKKSLPSAC
jgi:DNA polymerase III epsilon subunit family exonuclease